MFFLIVVVWNLIINFYRVFGISNMKFVFNGGFIIGICDGVNIEIMCEIGENNIFLFGNFVEDVEDFCYVYMYGMYEIDFDFNWVFQEIEKGIFGSI